MLSLVHEDLDEAHAVGVFGLDEVSGTGDDHRLTPAHEPRHPLRAAAAGNQPDTDLRLAEAGGSIRHAHVARQGQLAATADAEAVHGRDHGLGAIGHGLVHASLAVDLTLFVDGAGGELGDVRPGHEGLLAGAMDHDHLDLVVRRQRVESLDEKSANLGVQGVELLGAVDRDNGNAVLSFRHEYRGFTHFPSLQS